jgi:signal transduction histidine kinase
LRRLQRDSFAPDRAYQQLARVQIGLDWLATALLLYLTGGIESPAIFLFLLHIVIASIMLPHDRGYLYVALAPALVGAIALLEYLGILPVFSIFSPSRYNQVSYVAGQFAAFTLACYGIAFFSMTLSRRLRRREEQLATLHGSLQATSSTLDVPKVLDRLAVATTYALHCQAADIRLLNKSGSHLEIASAYGLSASWWERSSVEVARTPIDQEVLSGQTVLISDTTTENRLCNPDLMADEGIVTMLCAPLIGKSGPLGVLRASGRSGHTFDQDDADFLSTLAAQSAVAIENARAYQMLEDLDQQKSQFVRIVTHELRSPVQVAGSLLNVLGGGYVGELTERQADLVARAKRRIDFLQTLIDDLLDLAAGRADVLAKSDRGLVSLTDTLQVVRERYQAPAEEKGLTLLFEYPEEPMTVWGDQAELDRMLNNLVSNAVKYTQEGQVTVRVQREGRVARIVVSDTGIGIPHEALPDLFQEFFRAKNAKALEESGTGLGLSIVKDLVERYGGEIDVQSAEGQGTAFTLSLPLTGSQLMS